MHWALQYIGKPWVSGARGPDRFDCWGLLCHVYREHFGIELPLFPGIDAGDNRLVARMIHAGATGSPEWERIASPVDGCAVAMGGARVFRHVGIYLEIDGGLVLHCGARINTVAQALPALRQSGMQNIAFFKHGAYNRNTKPLQTA